MIPYLIAQRFLNIIDTLFVFNIPQFDAVGDFFDYFNYIFSYGIEIYRYFIPPFGQAVISLIIVFKVALFIYSFVVWFLHKIPMINID